jgi:endonuclease/exonuclease/phosphatase family metal-dependent hydrolase
MNAISVTDIDNSFAALCLNIRFGIADDGANSWHHRKDAFSGLLTTYPADFICLQEVNDFQGEYIASLLPNHRCIGKRAPAPPFWQNNIIFYSKKWTCLQAHHFFLSPTPAIPSRARDSRWPRQCTVGVFERHQHKLICITTHFDFKSEIRVESAQIILRHLSTLSDEIPALLMGDFNAAPHCPCYSIFTRGSADRTPFFRNAATAPYAGTYHGFTGRADEDAIDWILYRGEIKLLNFRIIRDPFNGYYPSDHFPLHASFKWH